MSMPKKLRKHDVAAKSTNPCGGRKRDCTCTICLLVAPVGPNISRMADLIAREIDAQVAARLSETPLSDTEETNR